MPLCWYDYLPFQLHCAHGSAAQVPAEQQYMKLKPRPPRRERTNSEQRKQRQTIANEHNIVHNKFRCLVVLSISNMTSRSKPTARSTHFAQDSPQNLTLNPEEDDNSSFRQQHACPVGPDSERLSNGFSNSRVKRDTSKGFRGPTRIEEQRALYCTQSALLFNPRRPLHGGVSACSGAAGGACCQ